MQPRFLFRKNCLWELSTSRSYGTKKLSDHIVLPTIRSYGTTLYIIHHTITHHHLLWEEMDSDAFVPQEHFVGRNKFLISFRSEERFVRNHTSYIIHHRSYIIHHTFQEFPHLKELAFNPAKSITRSTTVAATSSTVFGLL
jgi:hypothetical protein